LKSEYLLEDRKMKKVLVMLMATALVAVSQAAVLAYEGFGDAVNNATIAGYSGTNAEAGLTGTWSLAGTGSQKLTSRATHEYVGVAGGYTPDTVGGNQHWWEHNNNWTINTATRSLSGTIDLSIDGTTYMSFFSMSGKSDYLAQVGLNDGTNELMFGQAYSGAANKGLTAYYGAIGTSAQTNCNGTTLTYGSVGGKYKTGFYVAEFVKSNSGITDDLLVNLMWFDFGVMAAKTNGLSTDASRSIALSGVSSVFNTLELKLSGGSNWPSIDEIRVGGSFEDVAGTPLPEPATMLLFGLGGLLLRRKM